MTVAPARPDVSTALLPSESGIPADPPRSPLSSASADRKGRFSNLIPRMNPIMIPRMNPQRNLADEWTISRVRPEQ